MAALPAFSSHLFVLVLHCYLGASSSSSSFSSSSAARRSSRSASSSSSSSPSSSSSRDAIGSSPLRHHHQVPPLFLHHRHHSPVGRDQREDNNNMVSEHMFKLYDKCNREESRLREGNTVRSFTAQRDTTDQRTAYYRLNLTSIQDTEAVLSATFHFLLHRRPDNNNNNNNNNNNQRAWFCRRFRSPPCWSAPLRQQQQPSPSVRLLFRSVRPGAEGSSSSLLANVTFHPHRRGGGAWQTKDVTPAVKQAREKGHALVWVELDFGGGGEEEENGKLLLADALPYLLLYADDRALGEPNSVAASLQRYDPFPSEGGEEEASRSPRVPHRRGTDSSPELAGRARREAAAPDPIHDNELPEVEYHRPDGYMKDDLWERTWHLALKPKAKPKKKRKGQEEGGGEGGKQAPPRVPQVPQAPDNTEQAVRDKKPRDKDDKSEDERRSQQGKDRKRHQGRAVEGASKVPSSPVLSFDERTMRKARRRQGGEGQERGCARRNLRVDFADIGWSEWVVAPKAFEAYYCAGTCGFPMPKVLRPSNHATIQSIVRAVGIVPGVPEPCCVPEKMSPLAVLYRDEAGNLVLKVYPNMSIQSCSCR